MDSHKQPQPKKNVLKYSGLGIQLVIICVALLFGGKWLDDYFGYDYLFVLIGLFVSVFSVMYILIKKLK